MAENSSFSFEVSVQQGNGFQPLPDLVAFDLCKAYPVADGKLLLHNHKTGIRSIVMPEVYAALLSCSQLQTMDQHVNNIIAANPGMQGQQADIRSVLQNMLDSGIMISAKKTCESLKQHKETTAVKSRADAPVVAIITWERPQALERLLESILVNCDFGSFHRLYVIDDSRKTENILKNQAVVTAYQQKGLAPLQYFGLDEQQNLMDGLITRLPQHKEDIRFVAEQSIWEGHWTCGRSRNLALLVSCGRRLVVMDDDTICEVHNPPAQKSDISYSDSPRENDFYASDQDWAPLRQPLNPDPVSRHMQCLGLSFSEALGVLGSQHLKPAGLHNATALLISELRPGSPVLITECGSFGCPGSASNAWLPYMSSDSVKKMLASERKTHFALTRRKVWSGRNSPHFAPRANMSQITGLDNTRMLPPYIPITRGEDRVFASTVDFIFPHAVTLDYPWAVPHLPIPERTWTEEDLDFTPKPLFPYAFFEKMLEQKSACLAQSPTDRLAVLAAWFNSLAAASNESLIAMYRDSRLQNDVESLQQLRALLSTAESAPAEWQDYLRNGIEQLERDVDGVSRADFDVNILPTATEHNEPVDFWKDFWRGFASALTAWPQIRKAAVDVMGD
jgi:hypothetical protein